MVERPSDFNKGINSRDVTQRIKLINRYAYGYRGVEPGQ